MIGFDTAPLIWGVQGWASSTQTELIARTRRYIQHLSKIGKKIMVPAPVLGEFLTSLPFDEQDKQRAIVERYFFIPALDVEAVALAAKLQTAVDTKKLKKQFGISKPELKVDAQIVAIAIVQGAEKIITNDVRHFSALAGGRIAIEEVPDVAEQSEFEFAST